MDHKRLVALVEVGALVMVVAEQEVVVAKMRVVRALLAVEVSRHTQLQQAAFLLLYQTCFHAQGRSHVMERELEVA